MTAHVRPIVRIQAEDFDTGAEIARLTAGAPTSAPSSPSAGFAATRRDSWRALELEHYPGMAEAEIAADRRRGGAALAAERAHRDPPLRPIAPGENIVLVVAASSHRQAAFEAASFLMDYLKSRAPFWKKEHRADGSAASWVEAKDADERAAARWKAP